jgi:hypothetical protein
MEDMSKKTKRLEKENETFKRKHDATNANIFRMAEEREDLKKRQEAAEKKCDKLMSIIRNMQQQGRKIPPGAHEALESYSSSGGNGESEYSNEDDPEDEEDEEDEDEEEESEEYEDDESEEDKPLTNATGQPQNTPAVKAAPRPFGPERPPHQQAQKNQQLAHAQTAINGH